MKDMLCIAVRLVSLGLTVHWMRLSLRWRDISGAQSILFLSTRRGKLYSTP